MTEKLKTKRLTKVCMGVTSVFCSCWKFFRTKTPIRNVNDFDYYIWDLRLECKNEFHYKDTVANKPFFMKLKDKDVETNTINYNIKIGDMGLNYSLESFKKKTENPTWLREPTSVLIKRELLRDTVSSHSTKNTVDLAKYKEQKLKEGNYERLRQRNLS